MPQETSAGAIIFRRDNKEILFLLLYRKAHGKYKELWDFPRGLRQGNEQLEDTAKREVTEETGIDDAKILPGFKQKYALFYRSEGNLIHKQVVMFLGETQHKEVNLSEEHDNYAWCSLDDAIKKLTHKNSKDALKKADEFLKSRLTNFI